MAPRPSSVGERAVLSAPIGPELLVEVEVARRALLEPQTVLLRGFAQEVGRLFEDVLGCGLWVWRPAGLRRGRSVLGATGLLLDRKSVV